MVDDILQPFNALAELAAGPVKDVDIVIPEAFISQLAPPARSQPFACRVHRCGIELALIACAAGQAEGAEQAAVLGLPKAQGLVMRGGGYPAALAVRGNPSDHGGVKAGFYAQHGRGGRFARQGCGSQQQGQQDEEEVFHGGGLRFGLSCRGEKFFAPTAQYTSSCVPIASSKMASLPA